MKGEIFTTHNTDIKCPLCDGGTEYRNLKNTHIWICQECPGILFEFVDETDYENLGKMLK